MIKTDSWLYRYSVALSRLYLIGLWGWLLIYWISGDRWWYMGAINSLAVYFFFPLPLAGVVAIWSCRKELVAGALLGVIVFLFYWGPLFSPRVNIPTGNGQPPPLRVMTYNVLGLHDETDAVIQVIWDENPDVVCFQELNRALAEAIQSELGQAYPYQILDPTAGLGVSGIGTISRYPLVPTGEQLPLDWVGVPQVLYLDYGAAQVTLVNFHMLPYSFKSVRAFATFQNKRLQQAQALRNFTQQIDGPLIAAGDANDTFLSDSYHQITQGGLQDAWWEAGFGLGHTFPGSKVPGSMRPHFGPLYAPQWLTRIDHIFVSAEWGVQTAQLAEFDGVSDHRGVIATLVLEE